MSSSPLPGGSLKRYSVDTIGFTETKRARKTPSEKKEVIECALETLENARVGELHPVVGGSLKRLSVDTIDFTETKRARKITAEEKVIECALDTLENTREGELHHLCDACEIVSPLSFHVAVSQRDVSKPNLMTATCNIIQENKAGVSTVELLLAKQVSDSQEFIDFLKKLSMVELAPLVPKILYATRNCGIIDYLIERGVSLDEPDCYGFTPLFRAYENEDKEHAAFLLRNDADPLLNQPFHFLARKGSLELIKLLKRYLSGEEEFELDEGFSLMDSSSPLPMLGMMNDFLDNIDEPDVNGDTPLMIYCAGRHVRLSTRDASVEDRATQVGVRGGGDTLEKQQREWEAAIAQFVEWGCRLTRKNNSKFPECPIEVIAKNKLLSDEKILNYVQAFSKEELVSVSNIIHHTSYRPLIECFLNHGVSIDVRNPRGYTALYLAADQLDVEHVKWLISKRANPSFLIHTDKTLLTVEMPTPRKLIENKLKMFRNAMRNESFLKLEAQVHKTTGQVVMFQKAIQLRKNSQPMVLPTMRSLAEKVGIPNEEIEELINKMRLSTLAALRKVESLLLDQNEKYSKKLGVLREQYKNCEQILEIFESPEAIEEAESNQATQEMSEVSENEGDQCALDGESVYESPDELA